MRYYVTFCTFWGEIITFGHGHWNVDIFSLNYEIRFYKNSFNVV